MSKFPRLFGLLFLLMLGVAALSIASTGHTVQAAPVQSVVAQACDPSGSINGEADPNTVLPGQNITFTVRGFTAGEEVSFWFTTPGGEVFGTNAPLCCVPPGGTIRFARVRIPEEFGQEPGKWAFTVQGAGSNHTAVVYFCVVTQIQPTTTPVPPTNTAVPPTNTAAPTATVVAASPTAEVSPTAAASPTAEVSPTVATSPTAEATATTAVSTPTTEATVAPTMTSAPLPTEVVTVPPTATTEVLPMPQPTVVGMPRTGSFDNTPLLIMGLIALGVMAVGVMSRRTARARR